MVSSREKRPDLCMRNFPLALVWSTEGGQSRCQETQQEAHTSGPGWCWGAGGEKGAYLRAVKGES